MALSKKAVLLFIVGLLAGAGSYSVWHFNVIPVLMAGEANFAGPGVGPADMWTSTSSPSDSITQRIWGRDIKLTGYESLDCIGTDANGLLESGTCTGGAGGGLGTTSPWSGSGLAYRVSEEDVSTVATTTLTASSPLALSQPVVKVGGTNSVLTIDTSGTWSGNAGTASALAADPTDCSAGSFTLGINAAGTAQGCTDAWTEAENTAANYEQGLTAGDALTRTGDDFDFDGGTIPAGDLDGTWASPTVDNDSHDHTSLTISGIDISADTNLTAGDALTLTDDDLDFDGGATPGGVLGGTWASPTLDDNYLLNTGDTGAGSYTLTYASTTGFSSPYASSTNLFAGNFTFGGVTGNSWDDFCVPITGGSGLCDGADAEGAGGSANSKWATSTSPATGIYPNMQGYVGIGTTTPRFNLQLSSSTAPQLSLTDSSLTANQWAFRTDGGNLYVATSSPATFATSTNTSLAINGTSGNVGIGTANPTTKLHVSGNEGGGFGYLVATIENTNSGGRAELSLDTDDGAFAGFVAMAGSATSNDARQFDIGTRLGGIGFWSNDLQNMTLTKSGRLGVATTNPTAALQIGNAFMVATTTASSTAMGGLTIGGNGTTTGNHIATCVAASTNEADNGCSGKMFIRQSGTSNSSGFVMVNSGATASARWYIDANAVQRLDNGSSATGPISLNGAGTGRIGIQTLVPAYTLDVSGSIRVGSTGTLLLATSTAPTTGAQGAVSFDTTSNNIIAASSTSGHFVVASATTSLYAFSVASTSVDFVSGGNIDLPSHFLPQNIIAVWCKVDSGTSQVINFSDGTNDTNTATCTTTGAQYAITSNNQFTANEAIRIEFGTKTGSPDYLTLRVLGYRTSD